MGIKAISTAVIITSLSAYSVLVQAAVIESIFSPQVTIFKSSVSDALEIIAKKNNFIAQYDESKHAFKPISIPFEVRSRKGTPINYRLTLPLSQHFCKNTVTKSITPLTGLQFWLDGQPLAPVASSLPGNRGYLFEKQVKNNHIIGIQYPPQPQTNVEQQCYGILGVQAEIEL
ncbi:hypothetical protein [Photobacterium kishitanii]|uniref:Uncharacterized protein n=1 Tax=Photobacterium kishitanii TaxID=318456 RepID=A0A2T3K9Y7_9GAMM|nr:hypothetical protein [Photobacterium kishitanii]PSU87542.1 hypothetical protein C9J27_26075 [Photobacterium kishitanii]